MRVHIVTRDELGILDEIIDTSAGIQFGKAFLNYETETEDIQIPYENVVEIYFEK